MISAIDDVEDKDEFDMELLETASDVSKALCIAVEILSDLMTISKIESNMMVLHRSPVGVQKFIDDGVAAFAAEAREKKVNIVVHPLFDVPLPAETGPAPFRNIPATPHRPAPLPGADTRRVCRDVLGMTEQQTQRLIDSGVLFAADDRQGVPL